MFYQLTFLISPSLNQEEKEIFLKKIETFLKEKGEILVTETPKKIKLAYPIKKTKEAFVFSLEFQTPEDKIEDIKKEIAKEKDVLRYLLIKKIIKKRKERERIEKEEKEIRKPKIKKLKPEKTVKEKKVELEKIEEKLKELIQ